MGNILLTIFVVPNIWLGILNLHLPFQSGDNQKLKKKKNFYIQVSEVETLIQRQLEIIVSATEVLCGVEHSRYSYVKDFCCSLGRIVWLMVLTERRVNHHTSVQ